MTEQESKSIQRILLALLLPFVACGVQWLFWSTFRPLVWFLFYPTVFFSSRIGGRNAGLVSTAISAILVVYFFIPPQFTFLDKNSSHLISVAVFLFMGVLFSSTHERLEQAKRRAIEALEESRIASEQLQEARIGRLQAEQELTKEHLRMSQERFRIIFDHSPIAIGIGRRDDGRIFEVNDAWLRMLGFERYEVMGRTPAELNLYFRSEDRNEQLRIIEDHGQVINREIRLRRKSGEIIVVLYSAEIIELGGESFLQVMMTDTTEQKRMETELRRSEVMYRSLFSNMLNGFAYCEMIFDGENPIDFVYLSVNDAFEKQTGLKDVIGRRVSEVIPGIRDSDPGLFEIYGRVARTGEPEHFEAYVEGLKDWYWISVYSPAGDHFVAVFDVITERKRSEAGREATVELLRICNRANDLQELMQELMLYFRKLTGCEAIGVRLADGDDYPYYVTSGFSEEFVLLENKLCAYYMDGEPVLDNAGHPVLDCMCGNILRGRFDSSKPFFTSHGSFWSNCTSELLASTSDADRQARTRNRCNSEGYESVVLIPLRYRDETFGLFQFNDREKGRFSPENLALYEELVDYVSIALSKLKSDQALRDSKQALLEKNTEMERFTHMISHDLKSPLVTIKTFLGYLEQDMANSDTARIAKDLNYIGTAAERIELMLADLLELSRVGRKVNPPQSCTFLELAQSARNLVAGRIAERGVEVRVGVNDVALFGDCTRLLGIWQNLLDNACKFMGDQAHPLIEIGVEGCGRETVFYVADNGIGIDPRHQEKVFGLFEKMDRNSEGTGLGLALVKRIVELNGGTIKVESQGTGLGTCIRFTLPDAVSKREPGPADREAP